MADSPRSTRRQFLAGKSAVDAISSLSSEQAADSSEATSKGAAYLVQVERRAMACNFAVYLNAEQSGVATEIAVGALDLVDQLESQMTVYRDDSEISQLNVAARVHPVVVEQRLFGLFCRARELYNATSGAFDITSGPLSKLWGFFRREGRVPGDEELETALRSVGSKWLEIDEADRSIQYRHPELEINLGAIGKGYALDRCAELMANAGLNDFLIHGGQSSVTAQGNRLDGQTEPGWSVGVKHPLRPEQRLAEIFLCDQALSTSGSGTQSFRHKGKRFGHILDPRSGKPAEAVLSATVVAKDAATADALSTAFYVMGVEQTREFCEAHKDISALLVCESSQSGSIKGFTFGFRDIVWAPNSEFRTQ